MTKDLDLDMGYLLEAMDALSDAEKACSDAREMVRAMEQKKDSQRAVVGAAVRSLRVKLGLTADTMAHRHFMGSDALREYIQFEDTGRVNEYKLADITKRLLTEAENALKRV